MDIHSIRKYVEGSRGSVPTWIDGISTRLGYMVLATNTKAEANEEFGAVVAMPYGNDYKVKIYPNALMFNLEQHSLIEQFGAYDFRDRTQEAAGYLRFFLNETGLKDLVTKLQGTRHTLCPAFEKIREDIHSEKGKNKANSIGLQTGGYRAKGDDPVSDEESNLLGNDD